VGPLILQLKRPKCYRRPSVRTSPPQRASARNAFCRPMRSHRSLTPIDLPAQPGIADISASHTSPRAPHRATVTSPPAPRLHSASPPAAPPRPCLHSRAATTTSPLDPHPRRRRHDRASATRRRELTAPPRRCDLTANPRPRRRSANRLRSATSSYPSSITSLATPPT
jgi:hypothetical protein